MKKSYVYIFIMALIIVACKSNTKPGNNSSGGNAPSPIVIGKSEEAILKDLNDSMGQFESGDVTNWKDIPVSKNRADFAGGFFIFRLGDKWFVLGVSPDTGDNVGADKMGNIFLGSGDINKLQNAISEASDSANWDPRKLLFIDDAGNSRMAWAGRARYAQAGKSSSGLFDIVKPYKGYDNTYRKPFDISGTVGGYGILGGYTRVYFAQLGLSNEIQQKEKEAGINGEWNTDPNNAAAFIVEASREGLSEDSRKSWRFYADRGSPKKIGVSDIKNVRFGYVNSSTNITNQYPAGYSNVSSSSYRSTEHKLTIVTNGIPENPYDSRGPKGKTVTYRWEKATSADNFDGSEPDYSQGSMRVFFLTTVVGYNLRVQDWTDAPDEIKNKNPKLGVMEFDSSTYKDAISDGFSSIFDNPTYRSGTSGNVGIDGTGNTYKIPFIFIKN